VCEYSAQSSLYTDSVVGACQRWDDSAISGFVACRVEVEPSAFVDDWHDVCALGGSECAGPFALAVVRGMNRLA